MLHYKEGTIMQIKTNGYTKDIKQKRDILFSAKS